jgi:predicted dehydrogenase
MKRPLRVGIVGASAGRGWARISHVPAVRRLEGVELQAVVGSDQSKAEAANVAGIYAALRDDISKKTSSAPDFHYPARLTRLINDLISSAETGTRKPAADWPVP